MRLTTTLYLYTILISILLSGCATIIGGSKYNAIIRVEDRPKAQIIYRGRRIGTGSAIVKVKRKEANRFAFSVKEEGCKAQNYAFTSRTFRGWAFVGSLLGWTFITTEGGIPLPIGVVVDLVTGAVWKPNTSENGVSKDNYKNFIYVVQYTPCPEANPIDVVYLKNGSIIKGLIIEQVPNVQIKVQTKDGSILVFKFDEIEKIVK
jgi:hypothetical protein